jgi:hypothetical protein
MCLKASHAHTIMPASSTFLPVHAGVRKQCQRLGKTAHEAFVKVSLRVIANVLHTCACFRVSTAHVRQRLSSYTHMHAPPHLQVAPPLHLHDFFLH